MTTKIKPILLAGKEVYPIIEGGKGIAISNGTTAGSFAASNAIGTFSGAFADIYNQDGQVTDYVFNGRTRKERHHELVTMAIQGGIAQARMAYELSKGQGLIHMNILWEQGGAEKIAHGVLSGAAGMIHGVTCGAGMPYGVADIAEQYNIHYYPIVSSMRAFRALWKRSYYRLPHLLGAVVYEDPWLAGGHNGLSNNENPTMPEAPYLRVLELRKYMNEVGLQQTPIIMAGGVWYLDDWQDWIESKELGPVAFQFGTRPLLTQESPISAQWKAKLTQLKEGDIFLNRFSPTGFYSSAVNNDFIKELQGRHIRQVKYASQPEGDLTVALPVGARGRPVYMTAEDRAKSDKWIADGFDEPMKTPDSTLMFVTKLKAQQILTDQINCMGCLSGCKFSNWSDHGEDNNTGRKADPRSFCITKTLQAIAHGGDIDNELMFSGHNAYKFATDPFYQNGFIPTVAQLVERIITGR